jgi:hypothetical protein
MLKDELWLQTINLEMLVLSPMPICWIVVSPTLMLYSILSDLVGFVSVSACSHLHHCHSSLKIIVWEGILFQNSPVLSTVKICLGKYPPPWIIVTSS